MTPRTAREWRLVAKERGIDSKKLKDENRKLASLYFLGYVIECLLKAYIVGIGKKPVLSGNRGHDLRLLWETAGLKPSDFTAGKRWFVQNWSSSLRYEIMWPSHLNFEELCNEGYK